MKISKKTKLISQILVILIITILGLYGMGRQQAKMNPQKDKDSPTSPALDSIKMTNLDSIIIYQKSIVDTFKSKSARNFEYIYPRFKTFNPKIDSFTVRLFAHTMVEFKLDSTDEQRSMYTGQILLESGARQYKENGDLLVGSAGEIGICQIKPSTCYSYMIKYVDSVAMNRFEYIHVDDFNFVYDSTLTKHQKIDACRVWLTNIKNNIVMWGFITRTDLNRRGNIKTQLVAYNMGTTGMYRYVNNGGSLNQHKYIRKIKNKLSIAEKSLNDHEKSS
jgi:hypothetical protein